MFNFGSSTTKYYPNFYKRKKNGKQEGEITQIIKRARTEYVGIVQLNAKFAFVVPDSNKMPVDVFVPLPKTMKAEDGDKVLVTLEEWPEKADCPNGSIIKLNNVSVFLARLNKAFKCNVSAS